MKRTKAGLAACVIASIFLLIPGKPSHADDMDRRFQARLFSIHDFSLPYRLLKPKKYNPLRKYPLILFLHGSDERGTDNRKQLFVGLNIFAAEQIMDRYPCFIIAPQCPVEMKWADVDWKSDRHTMQKKPTEALAASIELARQLPKEFSIDVSRVYVAGYSMGGFGAWEAIQRWPDLFAAAVPVCGGGDETQASRIAMIPIWAFHGALDPLVKVARSRNMTNALVKAGGFPRYTEYPDINHFSWGMAFNDPALFEWLFRQKR